MSRDIYQELIEELYPRSISALVGMIGGRASNPRYTTSAFYQMDQSIILPCVRALSIIKVCGINTSVNISTGVN